MLTMAEDRSEAVVLDCGTLLCRAGFAGYDKPTSVFPNIIGGPRLVGSKESVTIEAEDAYIGSEAHVMRWTVKPTSPIERGIITKWDDMEKIWHHAFFNQLRIAPEEHPVLLSESVSNTKNNRSRTLEVMFERFGVPSCSVQVQAALALHATGRTTGLVLESGHGATHAVPVFDGCPHYQATKRLSVGGQDLTEYLVRMINERGFFPPRSKFFRDRASMRNVKERGAYVSLDFETEMGANWDEREKTLELPDGTPIILGHEQIRCPECLFDPAFVGVEGGGIHTMVYDAIKNCDLEVRSQLSQNIILSGGSMGFKGMLPRLENELNTLNLVDELLSKICISRPGHKHQTWTGGSLIASLGSFQSKWAKKEEYDERGPEIVDEKETEHQK